MSEGPLGTVCGVGSMAERKAVTKQVALRYRKASKEQKGVMHPTSLDSRYVSRLREKPELGHIRRAPAVLAD
jgi:hypothetical protein